MSSLTRLPARRAISAALQKDRITPAIRYVPGPSRSSLNRTYATHASGSTLSSPSINPEVAYRNGEAVSSGKLDVGIPEIGMQDTYDIVIIGAGNAGLALVASLLSKSSLRSNTRILLVEGGTLDRVRKWGQNAAPVPNGEAAWEWENRVSSLTEDNVAFLRDIGVWQHIEQSRSCPVRDMLVWTNTPASKSLIHFPTSSTTSQPMAYMTENTNLQRALLKRIDELSGNDGSVVISEGKRVEEMKMGDGGRWVGLRLGEKGWVRGSVVVGADGYNSPVRKFSAIDSFGHAYNTHAVVATLHHHPLPSNSTAFQRFLPTGPLAFLPLNATASTMVWSTKPELAAAYKALGAEGLKDLVNLGLFASEKDLERLNTALLTSGLSSSIIASESDSLLSSLSPSDFRSLPPPITSISPKSIASFPLRLSHAESYIGDRTVLVGDAAHTVHPLAGQGLNMGLGDVRCLAKVWDVTKRNGGDLGSYTAMLPYARERYAANNVLLSATDKLDLVFGTRIPLINWARSVGMDVINELTPVKKLFMQSAGARSAEQTQGRQKSWYESGADAMENWQTFKGLAKLGGAGVQELVKNGARKALGSIAASRGYHTAAAGRSQRRSLYTSVPRSAGGGLTNLFDAENMADGAARPRIQVNKLNDQGFHLSDGLIIPGGVIFVDDRAFLWDVDAVETDKLSGRGIWDKWTKERFAIFETVLPRPEILLLGTGTSVVPPPPHIREYISSLGIQLDVMDSRNACSTFNLLAEEGRTMAAALMPLRPINPRTGGRR